MFTTAWTAFKVSRAFRPVIGMVAVLALVGMVFMLGRCTGGNDDAAEQAEQTVRSGEAVAAAAEAAVATIGDSVATEASVDEAVTETITEIENAQDIGAVRDAVLDGVCQQRSHRNDPACLMRPPGP